MKILVTGGTGFIWSHLVKRLISKGHHIFCLIRDCRKGEILRNLGATLITGDITDSNLIEQIPEGIEQIHHLAGVLGKWNIPNQVYQDVHIRGTENMLKLCMRFRIKRFVHCSSAGVLGPTGEAFFDESFPYRPTSIYERTKAEAEKLVLTYAGDAKIDTTIIRPAVVYGPRDSHMLGLFKAVQGGFFPLIGSGKALLQPAYIEDVIHGFESCINNEKTINQIYILAGERPVTVKEFVGMIAKIIKAKSFQINIPSCRIAKFIASLFEVGGKIFPINPPFTRAVVKFFTENKSYKIDKAVQELDYKPINLEEGLRRTIEWYQENSYL